MYVDRLDFKTTSTVDNVEECEFSGKKKLVSITHEGDLIGGHIDTESCDGQLDTVAHMEEFFRSEIAGVMEGEQYLDEDEIENFYTVKSIGKNVDIQGHVTPYRRVLMEILEAPDQASVFHIIEGLRGAFKTE
jgi:hypothetical protein